MAKKIKKSLSMLLILSMLFNMFTIGGYAAPVYAADDDGFTQEAEPQTEENTEEAVEEENEEVNEEAIETEQAGEEENNAAVTIAEDADDQMVAKVGDVSYPSVAEAIAAANDGDEVMLLQDVLNSPRIVITKSVVIDLNGCTVGGGDAFATIMLNAKNAVVELRNGTISDTKATRGAIYVQMGTVILSDVTVNASQRGVGVGPGVAGYYGTAILNEGTKITATESGVGIFGSMDEDAPKSELVVNDAKITAQLYGIAGNGTNDGTVITINGGTVTATGGYPGYETYSAGIYHPQQGDLTITGGEISGRVGVQMAGGNATISGGTLKSTEDETVAAPYKAAQHGDGMVLDGAALSLVSRFAYGDINVEVTGGKFATENPANKSVQKYGMQKTATGWEIIDEPTNSKLLITGGEFPDNVTEWRPVKFSAWISSLLSTGETTTVMGTVDADYNAKLVLPNAVVNAGNVTVGVAMEDVASMGVEGKRQHEVTINTGLSTEANLPDTLAGLGAPALFNFDGATVNATIKANGDTKDVTYTLAGTEFTGEEAEKVITGTPDTEAARAAWQLMVNDKNFEIGTKANDSYIVIANGSTLQLGKEVLSFEQEGDLKLDNFNALNPADIKAMVKLDTVDEAAVTFTLKKGTELAVGSSYAKLNKDVTVTVTGVEGIDDLDMLSDLRDSSENLHDLLLGLIRCMDTTVSLIDAAGEVDVTIEFTEEDEPVVEPAVKFSAWISSLLKDGVTTTTVMGTVDAGYNAKLVLPNAVVNAGNVTVGVAMEDVASMGVEGKRQHEVTINTGLSTEANLPDTLAGLGASALFNFDGATVNATIKANGDTKDVTYTLAGTEFTGEEAEKVITGTTDTEAARAAWQLMVNDKNFEIGTKANDSYIVIANGSTLQLGKEVLSFEQEGDLKLDNFNALNPADIKAMVKLDTVDEAAVTFTLKKGTELAVGSSYAKLNKDVTVTVTGVEGIDDLDMLSDLRDSSENLHDLLLGLIRCMDTTVSLIDAAEAVDVTIEFTEPHNHTYGAPVWAWTKNAAGDYDVTVSFICEDDDDTVVFSNNDETNKVEVTKTVKDSTCAAGGETVYAAKVIFNEKPYTYTKTDLIGLKSHRLTHYEGKAAVCTAGGWAEYWVCSECHKMFTDANGENVTTIGGVVIPMLGHNAEGVVEHKDANCTEDGVVGGTYCTRCEYDKAAAEAVIEHLGHNSEGVVEHKDANCTEDGVVGGTYCTRCEYNKAAAEAVIEHLGHNSEGVVEHKDANCTEDGVVGGTYCTRCEYDKAAAEAEIEATGHTYGEVVWTWNADHTEAVATITCAACAEGTEGKTLSATATGEQITNVVTTPATRREPGVRTYTATVTLNGVDVTGTATAEIPRRTGGGGGGSSTTTPTTPVTPPTEITEPDVPLAELPMTFDDVKEGDWFYDAVKYAYDNELMKGDSATKFAPNNNTTRGMIALILYRMEKEPKAEGAGFPDVAANSWYKDAATWAVSVNVFKGYEDGTFRGDQVITREELAAVMFRYAEMKQYDVTAAAELIGFADGAAVQEWAVPAMKWAVAKELVGGREGNVIAPQANATRAELATILTRFADKVVPAAADKADGDKTENATAEDKKAEDAKTETK